MSHVSIRMHADTCIHTACVQSLRRTGNKMARKRERGSTCALLTAKCEKSILACALLNVNSESTMMNHGVPRARCEMRNMNCVM